MSTSKSTLNFDYKFIWRVCLVTAMGGLLFGYDWVVIGGAKPFYEQYFSIAENEFQQGLAMSSALLGCLLGALVSGPLTDRFGRKSPLLLSGLLFIGSSILTALATSLIAFNFARGIGGVGIGIASSLSPLYIAEISPAVIRGRMVSVNQLTIVIGILTAQVVNWVIASGVPGELSGAGLAETWCGEVGWRWMFAACAVPAIAFFLLTFTVPESPRWLASAGRIDESWKVLARVGGVPYANQEIVAIEEMLQQSEHASGNDRSLMAPENSRALVIGLVLVVLQQWCGINVIFNYADEIFRAAGYDVRSVMVAIVATGVVNLLFTVIAMQTVDRLGRRILMLVGCGGLAVLFVILGGLFHAKSTGPHMVALVLAAIGCYAMSLAPVTWVVISEIFPNRIRGKAMSVAVLALWLACTALTFTFPLLNKSLGASGTFWLYAAICAAGFVFVLKQLPETKGRSLEEIERILIRDSQSTTVPASTQATSLRSAESR